MTIAERLAQVREQIRDAALRSGRDSQGVRLIAVSKRQPIERIRAAYEAGHRDFGENYPQGLFERAHLLPGDVRWHMIGHLQSNKARRTGELAAMIHTVDSVKVARKLDLGAAARVDPVPVLVQVNVARERGKSGVDPRGLEELLGLLRAFENLQVCGLMVIPPFDEQPRRWFSALREARDRAVVATGVPLPELSMGMSGDFTIAVEEGATMVRVGTAIFGERDAN